MPQVTAGQFRPEPVDEGTVHEQAAWEKVNEVPGSPSLEGSGGSYISNEIFYRIARARDAKPRSLASGHLHVPEVTAGGGWSRTGLINGVKDALRKFLLDRFRLRSLGDVTFPNTAINTTSAPRAFTAKNETNETISIATVVVAPPFALVTTLPVSVNANAVLSLQFNFSPAAVGTLTGSVELRDASGEALCTAMLTGQGIPMPPAPVITSFNPLAAELGETVTIIGANLAGATAVRIGSIGTSFTVVDDTQIIADVTGPPRLAPITVLTPSGTAVSSGSFRVIFVRPPRD